MQVKEVSPSTSSEFADTLLTAEHYSLLSEAAAWTPPGSQCPWHHHLVMRSDPRAFEALLWCLGADARHIAATAPLMVWTTCESSGSADASQSMALSMLLVQARSLGLEVVVLDDIYHDRAAAVLGVHDMHDTVSAVLIGYSPHRLPLSVRQHHMSAQKSVRLDA